MANLNHIGTGLEVFHEKTLLSFLPMIIVMAVICVLGILGNAFTIAFYGFASRKSPTVFMITVLACVDLIVCVLIIPNMAEMGVNVKYTNAIACKTMHFLGHWGIESSALILWFISIDRYRHVCCPFRSQVNYVKAKVAMGIIIIFSFLLSARDFANFVIIEVPIPIQNSSDVGHYCTTTEEANYKLSVTIFHSIDAFLVVMVLVTLCIAYSRVLWIINKGGLSSFGRKTKEQQKPAVNRSKQERILESNFSKSSEQDELLKNNKNNKTVNGKRKLSAAVKIKKTERSITLMMFAVSLNFAVCFIPYFIVKLGIRSYKQASQLELGTGIQFAIRLVHTDNEEEKTESQPVATQTKEAQDYLHHTTQKCVFKSSKDSKHIEIWSKSLEIKIISKNNTITKRETFAHPSVKAQK